jgi:hypothetical protein
MASKLILDVLVNVKGAEKLDGIGGKLKSTGTNLTKYATLPLLGLGAAAVKLGADSQKADAQLGAAFKSMGASAFTSIEALNEHATALAKATQFDDEEIKHAQSVLLTFGKVTGETFTQTTDLAADMSAALGQDLQSSTIQLGKALNDPIKGITSLTRVGVQFTDEQKKMIASLVESGDTLGAQNVILGEVSRQFTGVSTAIGATDAGQAAQAFEELGEAGESIGVILLPILSKLAGFLKDLAVGFQGLPEPVKGFIVTFAVVAATLGPAILVGFKLVSAFKAVSAAFTVLKLVMLANPFLALAAAVVLIAALIIMNWDKIVGFLKEVWGKITAGFEGVAKALSGIWDGITGVVTKVWDGMVAIIKGNINAVISVINAFLGFMNGISFGAGPWDVGPIHVDAISIDPFNVPLIPMLAQGGIIDGATLAMLGERGPEAVIPLDRLERLGEHHSHIHIEGQPDYSMTEDRILSTMRRQAFLEGW